MSKSASVELILASASPRRREMLERIGLQAVVRPSHIEEVPHGNETAEQYAARNAGDKARQVATLLSPSSRSAIVGADTVVVLNNRILEKPQDENDARRMLRDLSGNIHTVITGVCVVDAGVGVPLREQSFTSCTEVEFKSLREAEIDAYIASGEPMDKAGAYAIQGLGACMIRRINGSYTNVVGLPLCELVDLLEREFGLFPTTPVRRSVIPL